MNLHGVRALVLSRLRQTHESSLINGKGKIVHGVTLNRDGALLAEQPCSITTIKPSKGDGNDAAMIQSVPDQYVMLAGLIDFDVKAGDTFTWNANSYEIVEQGEVGITSVARRAKARMIISVP